MSKISRRDLLRYSAYGFASVVVSNGLTACGGDDDDNVPMEFSHGVASGDPQSDKVIIWTRAIPLDTQANSSIRVQFEVATDANFANITNRGESDVNADTDFTLKVDVQNLSSDTTYYYRFSSNGETSTVGRTKTLPSSDASISQVKFAVFSCSNYPTGYFNVYGEAANISDLDAALHLGDYIYEYRSGEFGTENAEAIGRTLPADNDVEIIELDDYRKRYALYRSDEQLQTLHQNVAFIVVPDDHEVTNDTYDGGAENHDPETEGDFSVRKANALQAYFEWLPIRPANLGDNETIFRSFQWGNLVNLIMLDTRLAGRTEQLPALADPSWIDPNTMTFDAARFAIAVSDNTRTMLGAPQLEWLSGQLANSTSTWQVLGQQVLMGKMNIPLEVLVGLGGDVSTILGELAVIKSRILAGDETVTEQERARVNTVAPYNLDAWDGYQFEREVIYGTSSALAKNLVVLAGDTHNAWANNLRDINGSPVGVEFACASVTSPGLEGFLQLDEPSALGLEQGLSLLIDELQYANYYDRGFMVVTFTESNATANWQYVDNIESTTYSMRANREVTMTVNAGQNVISS